MQDIPVRLADIRDLFLARGHFQYTGESVSHLEHALQCAAQAEHVKTALGSTRAALGDRCFDTAATSAQLALARPAACVRGSWLGRNGGDRATR
jgi:hypothetical protein